MSLRTPLYLQTIGMLCLYLAVLLIAVFVACDAQFGVGLESLVQSPIGARIDSIADSIGSQLRSSPVETWNQVLNDAGKIYQVNFYIYDHMGRQQAGEKIDLPPAVSEQFTLPEPFQFSLIHGTGKVVAEVGMPSPPPAPSFSRVPDFEPKGTPPPFPLGQSISFATASAHPFFGFPPPHTHGPFYLGVKGRRLSTRLPPPPPPARFVVHTQKPDRLWFGTNVMIREPSTLMPMPSILLASCQNIWDNSLLFDSKLVASAISLVAAFSLLFWWPFIYQITRALSQLTKATERIAEGHFDTRLNAKRRDEIGGLSEAVNTMAERLDSFVSGQKRFLGAISHELRTPIARLQMALELLDASSTTGQKELILDIKEEVEEMTNLVNDLLAFSKAGLQAKKPQLMKIPIQSFIDDLISRSFVDVLIQCDMPNHLLAIADPLLLERSLSNLLRNGVRYAGEAGPITITAERVGLEIALLITDKGPGVKEDALKHLGEPFFRPEASRSRQSGGVGLGLAIVKSCIESCGGTASFRNGQNGGFEAELRLKADLETVALDLVAAER